MDNDKQINRTIRKWNPETNDYDSISATMMLPPRGDPVHFETHLNGADILCLVWHRLGHSYSRKTGRAKRGPLELLFVERCLVDTDQSGIPQNGPDGTPILVSARDKLRRYSAAQPPKRRLDDNGLTKLLGNLLKPFNLSEGEAPNPATLLQNYLDKNPDPTNYFRGGGKAHQREVMHCFYIMTNQSSFQEEIYHVNNMVQKPMEWNRLVKEAHNMKSETKSDDAVKILRRSQEAKLINHKPAPRVQEEMEVDEDDDDGEGFGLDDDDDIPIDADDDDNAPIIGWHRIPIRAVPSIPMPIPPAPSMPVYTGPIMEWYPLPIRAVEEAEDGDDDDVEEVEDIPIRAAPIIPICESNIPAVEEAEQPRKRSVFFRFLAGLLAAILFFAGPALVGEVVVDVPAFLEIRGLPETTGSLREEEMFFAGPALVGEVVVDVPAFLEIRGLPETTGSLSEKEILEYFGTAIFG